MAASLADGGVLGVTQKKELQSFAKRAIELVAERARIGEEITEVMNEAREAGFDPKILRKAIKIVTADEAKAKAEAEMVDSYVSAIQPDLFDGKKAA